MKYQYRLRILYYLEIAIALVNFSLSVLSMCTLIA